MKNKVLEYYKTHEIVYPSDIASEYDFDLREVVKVVDDLIQEGKVKVKE